jgi:hypothetical protein
MEPFNRESSGKEKGSKALNHYLDIIAAKVHEARHYLLQLGKPVTSKFIRDILRGNQSTIEKKYMLLEVS